jgi:MFS family permease
MSADALPWRRNLAVLWAAQFLVTASLTVVVPLLPFHLEALGATDPAANGAWTGLALAAPAITLMVAAPVWGRIGDRVGRKWMVVRALAGIALSVLAMGLARTPVEFVACRLAQGLLGGVDDAAAVFASTQVPVAARGRALGWLQSSTAAGALAGPLAGGFLSIPFGFAPVLLAVGTLVALAAAAAALLLTERRSGPIAAAPVAMVLGDLVRSPTVRAFLLAGLLVQVGTYGLIGAFALRVRDLLADPLLAPAWVGCLQAVGWGTTLVAAAWWGRRNEVVPVERNVLIATGAGAAAIALQALPRTVEWLVPLRAAQGFCTSAVGQSVYLLAVRDAPPGQHGLRIGVANGFLTLGQVLGALAGAVLAAQLAPAAIIAAMGGCYAAAALAILRVLRPLPPPAPVAVRGSP